jgi:monothiol glutaredoxin
MNDQNPSSGENAPLSAHDRVDAIVKGSPVVFFMKGTPNFPMCGFSARVAQALANIGVPYQAVNVLADAEIREGVKAYGNWPTIPQLYVNGELVGGCDITMALFQSGELATMLTEASNPAS